MTDTASPANGDVLIVDDEEAITTSMRRYLRAAGFRVDTAGSQAEAEAMIGRRRYELLIVDLRLCPGDGHQGLDLLDFARRHSPSTRTVVLTAYGSPELEEAARAHGARCFLHKPQPLSEIARLVQELVAAAPV